MADGCGCGCGCSPEKNVAGSVEELDCPDCGNKGKIVPGTAVQNLVKKEYRDQLGDSDYYLCLNPDCQVVYFNKGADSFMTKQVRRPVWFKKGAEPQIACYCNNITYQQVKEAVQKHGLTTWKGIVLHYRKKVICQCDRLNPAGECCTDNFHRVINQALLEEGKEPVGPSTDCCC